MAGGDRSEIRLLALGLLAAVLLVTLLLVFLLPAAEPLLAALDEGLGVKASVPWGFGVTTGLFILLALVAGDGLIGELQFMLGAFFGFFVVLTLLIAWVF